MKTVTQVIAATVSAPRGEATAGVVARCIVKDLEKSGYQIVRREAP